MSELPQRPCPVCRAVGSFALVTDAEEPPFYVCKNCFTPFKVNEFPQNNMVTDGPMPPKDVVVTDHLTRTDLMGNKHKVEASRYRVPLPDLQDSADVVFNPNSPNVGWVLYYYKDKIRNRRRYNKRVTQRKVNERNNSVT